MSWWGQREVPFEHGQKLEQLVQRLRACDVATTYDTLHQLIGITPVDDDRVVEMLTDMLGNSDMHDESRRAISTAIERLFKRRDAATRGLVNLLGHLEGKIRKNASDLLSRLVPSLAGKTQATCVHDIAARLGDLNATTRTAAINCIRDIVITCPSLHVLCVSALCEQLKNDRPGAADAATDGLMLLMNLGQKADLISEVVDCLKDPSQAVRARAVKAVRSLAAADSSSRQGWIIAVAQCMDHQHETVRTSGSEALTFLSSDTWITCAKPRAEVLLWDPWELAYGREGQPCIVHDHLLQLPVPQKGVKAKSIDSRATVAHIGMRLEDPNPSVRQSAVESLCALRDAGEHDRMDLIRCCALRLDFEDDDVRRTAVDALGHLVRGSVEEEVAVILEWLERPSDNEEHNNTRVFAVRALGKVASYNDERVVRALLHATADADYRVIREALHVLDAVAHFGKH